MNASQKERLLKVVENDAKICFQYMDASDQTCIIGGLLVEVGMSADEIKGLGDFRVKSLLPTAFFGVSQTFGVSLDQLSDLQVVNDVWGERAVRQAALRKVIESWPIAEGVKR